MVSKIQKMLEKMYDDLSDNPPPRLGVLDAPSAERLAQITAPVKNSAKRETLKPKPQTKKERTSVTEKKTDVEKTEAPATSGKRDALWHVPAKLDTESAVVKGKVDTLAPQAKVIYETILNHGPMSREALCQRLAPVLQTRQPVERIVAFYRGPLIKAGLIQISPVGA